MPYCCIQSRLSSACSHWGVTSIHVSSRWWKETYYISKETYYIYNAVLLHPIEAIERMLPLRCARSVLDAKETHYMKKRGLSQVKRAQGKRDLRTNAILLHPITGIQRMLPLRCVQHVRCQKRPGVCQKRPGMCQKRPGMCQKRPGVCQKRPGVCQNRPIICQKRRINTSIQSRLSRACSHWGMTSIRQ